MAPDGRSQHTRALQTNKQQMEKQTTDSLRIVVLACVTTYYACVVHPSLLVFPAWRCGAWWWCTEVLKKEKGAGTE